MRVAKQRHLLLTQLGLHFYATVGPESADPDMQHIALQSIARSLTASNLELVVSADDAGSFSHGIDDVVQTVYHHNTSNTADASQFAGPPNTREAGVFLSHVTRRYTSLSGLTAFIHSDIVLHNPVWPRWLRCLRENVSVASLSPLNLWMVPGLNFSSALSDALGTPGGADRTPASCCFLQVQSRAAVREKPLAAYIAALQHVLNATGLTPAYDLERIGHTMHRLPRNWLDPCVSYRCEEQTCSRVVSHLQEEQPYVHGVPMMRASGRLHAWQNRACGVRSLDRPETRRVASVREQVATLCRRAMSSRDDLGNFTGCDRARRTESMRNVTRDFSARYARLQSGTSSAKMAVFALKQRMCTALVRCWTMCCAECARRPWCMAWEWHLPTGTCALSAEPAVPAPRASFEYAVGL